MSHTALQPADNQTQLQGEAPSAARRGRPRSQRSRHAILKATNSLLLHASVQELSIEAIAKKAKVGKTTIYRWWPNKTAVIMEAITNQPGLSKQMPTPKNNADAVQMQLEKLTRLLHSKNGQTIAQLFAEGKRMKKHRASLKIISSPSLMRLNSAFSKGRRNRSSPTAWMPRLSLICYAARFSSASWRIRMILMRLLFVITLMRP